MVKVTITNHSESHNTRIVGPAIPVGTEVEAFQRDRKTTRLLVRHEGNVTLVDKAHTDISEDAWKAMRP